MVKNLDKLVTCYEGFHPHYYSKLPSRGLVRSRDKLTLSYLHYQKIYDYKTRQCDDLP